MKVAGVWRYVYRAVDQLGRVIDIYVSKRRNTAAARRFFKSVLGAHGRPAEVTTDLAAPLLRVIDEGLFDALHDSEQYANNRVETDHGSHPDDTLWLGRPGGEALPTAGTNLHA